MSTVLIAWACLSIGLGLGWAAHVYLHDPD